MDRGILFTSDMVRAIGDGRKTQTRRVIKRQPDKSRWKSDYVDKPKEWRKMVRLGPSHHGFDEDMWCLHDVASAIGSVPYTVRKCPYGVVGDRLYVKEPHYRYGTWYKKGATKTGKQARIFIGSTNPEEWMFEQPDFARPMDYTDSEEGWYKRSPLFMPKKFARLWLEITGIRVERVNSISKSDAVAEGVIIRNIGETYWRAFHKLWDSINGKRYPWKCNCWVWVVSFKRITRGREILNEAQVRSIRRLRYKGDTIIAIAERHGISETCARDVIKRRTYSHIV